MLGREQAAGEAEADDGAGGGDSAEDEEHDHGLDEDGLDGVDAGQDEAGHGGEEHQPDGFGGFDLGRQSGAQGGGQVGAGGLTATTTPASVGLDDQRQGGAEQQQLHDRAGRRPDDARFEAEALPQDAATATAT